MPRKLLKRYLPSEHHLRDARSMGLLHSYFREPSLWHLHRRSVANAFAIGLFMAWVPVPFQMLLAGLAAVLARVNLPISVGLVWITNPITIPPMFYFAYRVGAQLLGAEPLTFEFELSLGWLWHGLTQVWQPFLLGCFTMAVVSSLAGLIFVRVFWRVYVVRRRRRKRG